MNKLTYNALGETLYHEKLENGLEIFVLPKKDFAQSYAHFATNYGSVDARYRLGGQWSVPPEGVAHFLEHKMFDTKEGNALQIFSQNGASPNAFTSHSTTAYHFDCTEKFEENLRLLLSFVSEGYFTEESVQKEQGIIGQEIGMSNDDPEWVAYNGLLETLYGVHPVRGSILGTVESIGQITAQTLYDLHGAFYRPSNMVLCAAGDVDPDTVVRIAREMLPAEKAETPERDYGNEDHGKAFRQDGHAKMALPQPLFMLGVKCTPVPAGPERLRRELLSDLTGEALCGKSSPLYADLYAKGLINRSFSVGYFPFSGGGCMMISGESRDPAAVRAAILAQAERTAKEGFDKAYFDRLKKTAYGQRLRMLDSVDNFCHQQASAFFDGAEFLTFPEIYKAIRPEDAACHLQDFFRPEKCSLFVVSDQ